MSWLIFTQIILLVALCLALVTIAFIYNLKAWHLVKNEKMSPTYAFKSEKKISLAKRIDNDYKIQQIIDRG